MKFIQKLITLTIFMGQVACGMNNSKECIVKIDSIKIMKKAFGAKAANELILHAQNPAIKKVYKTFYKEDVFTGIAKLLPKSWRNYSRLVFCGCGSDNYFLYAVSPDESDTTKYWVCFDERTLKKPENRSQIFVIKSLKEEEQTENCYSIES